MRTDAIKENLAFYRMFFSLTYATGLGALYIYGQNGDVRFFRVSMVLFLIFIMSLYGYYKDRKKLGEILEDLED